MWRVTIVFPCYNEGRRLEPEVFISFLEQNPAFRFLFVDDGSTDNTPELLCRICEACPKGQALSLKLEKNSGKAEAVRTGILTALEDSSFGIIGFMDSDLATPLDELPKLLEPLASGCAIVLGARIAMLGTEIDRRTVRHYMGRLFATFASLTLGLKIYDTQCGAKLFRSCSDLKALFEEPFHVRWTFDIEILARLKVAGSYGGHPFPGCAIEVPLRSWTHKGGSKVRPWDFFISLIELARIRRLMRVHHGT